jgi:antitoxin (DNA-binding transcriptional repressor) of toxin-antitoxin stability system
MKTIQISKFKARCLGLLKEVHDTGESIAITLRGETLAIVHPPGSSDPLRRESVSETLQRLRPLLTAEDTDLELPPRDGIRPSTRYDFAEED